MAQEGKGSQGGNGAGNETGEGKEGVFEYECRDGVGIAACEVDGDGSADGLAIQNLSKDDASVFPPSSARTARSGNKE